MWMVGRVDQVADGVHYDLGGLVEGEGDHRVM